MEQHREDKLDRDLPDGPSRPRRGRGRPRQGEVAPRQELLVKPEAEALVDVNEIARVLSIPPRYVYELVKRHQIPAMRVGKYLRFRQSDVLRALNDSPSL